MPAPLLSTLVQASPGLRAGRTVQSSVSSGNRKHDCDGPARFRPDAKTRRQGQTACAAQARSDEGAGAQASRLCSLADADMSMRTCRWNWPHAPPLKWPENRHCRRRRNAAPHGGALAQFPLGQLHPGIRRRCGGFFATAGIKPDHPGKGASPPRLFIAGARPPATASTFKKLGISGIASQSRARPRENRQGKTGHPGLSLAVQMG